MLELKRRSRISRHAASLAVLAGAAAILAPRVPAQTAPCPAGASASAAAGRCLDRARDRTAATHASAYLPLGHWAYPIVEYWISTGRIDDLSPFVKPWRRLDVARAILDIAEGNPHGFERSWIARLETELAPELALLRGDESANERLELHFGLAADYYSQTHRDVLRPELDGPFSDGEVFERMIIDGHGQGGVLAGGFRGERNKFFVHDAQFPGGRVVPELNLPVFDEGSMRVEEGYAELQTKYARVFFGRMYRNWGAPRLLGFLRSNYAYSEEEIGYRLGTGRVFLIGSFASYSDFQGDTTHYVAIHRLEIRPIDDLMIAVSEAAVHGGPSQNLDFRLVNPVGVWQIARSDNDPPHNKIGQLDLWWRAGPGFVLYGSLLADATNEEESCCQLGGSAGFELPSLVPGLVIRANATAIQSLAYRTSLPWEEYSVENIGIGWDKTDLYLATLEADWFGPGGLLLRPRLDVQVKGAGDFRSLRPPFDQLPTFPRILVGDAERTIRPALAGRWRSTTAAPFDLEWDLGVNFIQDYRNVTGDDRTEFVGTFKVLIESPRISALFD
ncbi:MAG: hypothetical protein ACE5HF_06885 [Gemmatimonadota bacterium]